MEFARPAPSSLITKYLATKLVLTTSTTSAKKPSRSSKLQPNITPPKSCLRSMAPSLPRHLQLRRATLANSSLLNINHRPPALVFLHHPLQTFGALPPHRKPRATPHPSLLLPLSSSRTRLRRSSSPFHPLTLRIPRSKEALHQMLTPTVESTSNNHTGTIVFWMCCWAKTKHSPATGWL